MALLTPWLCHWQPQGLQYDSWWPSDLIISNSDNQLFVSYLHHFNHRLSSALHTLCFISTQIQWKSSKMYLVTSYLQEEWQHPCRLTHTLSSLPSSIWRSITSYASPPSPCFAGTFYSPSLWLPTRIYAFIKRQLYTILLFQRLFEDIPIWHYSLKFWPSSLHSFSQEPQLHC